MLQAGSNRSTIRNIHGVIREKLLEFRVELGRQRFIVGQDERRFFDFLDDVGHRKRFSGAGYAEQCLEFFTAFDARGSAFQWPAAGRR
jgi:hypothetical protein